MLIVDVQHPDDLNRKIRVGVLGSCRARDLLVNMYKSEEATQAMGNSVPCEIVTYNFGIFTHTPRQAIQYYNFLKNRTDFMEEIQPLIFWKKLEDAQGQLKRYTAELLDSIELLVVEASTLNNFTCDGMEVNASYVEQQFIKVGGKPLLNWWRAVTTEDGEISQDIVNETISALPSKGIPDNENVRFILNNLRKRVETKEEFYDALTDLTKMTDKPLVVVPHFDLTDAPIEKRHPLRSYIKEFSSDLGYGIFDSTDLIGQHGREVALAGEGSSICHYSHSFHHVLLNNFRPFLHDFYEQQRSSDSVSHSQDAQLKKAS